MENLEFETSTKTSGFKPARIKKGYYAGQLIGARIFADQQGTPIENKKYGGRQVILDFGVYRVDDEGNVAGPVTVKEENTERDVILSAFVNVEYWDTNKDKSPKLDPKTGKHLYRSALTKNSRATATFMALGWKGPEEGKTLRPEEFLGAWAELNIDDYEKSLDNGQKEIRSSINGVKAFPGVVNSDVRLIKAPSRTEVSEDKIREAQRQLQEEEPEAASNATSLEGQLADLKDKLDNGLLTQKGYDMAVEQLKAKVGK